MPREIDEFRRRFFSTVAMTLAAGRLGVFDIAHAQSGTTTQAAVPERHTSFASMKQINAGALNVGYAEAGPANGPAVLLLHGWPYDIHTYVDVAPLLAARGYRVIVPYFRGYGSTRFLSLSTTRNGQTSVIALDVIALMDALSIDKAIVAGCDWGAYVTALLGLTFDDSYAPSGTQTSGRTLEPATLWAETVTVPVTTTP